MKYFAILFLIAAIISCGIGKPDAESEQQYKVTITQNYVADTINSVINWVRDVENKVVNKQIQIFGSTTTVNMENVKFSSNGTMPLLKGEMKIINDSFASISLTVSFTMVRLYSNNSNEAISSETFPPSLMQITDITPDTLKNHYQLEGELSIKDKTGKVKFPATITQDSTGNYVLNGICRIQTVEYPIREEADPDNINYDIISLNLNIIFNEGEVVRDSVAIE